MENIILHLANLERSPVHEELDQLDDKILNLNPIENNKAKYENT